MSPSELYARLNKGAVLDPNKQRDEVSDEANQGAVYKCFERYSEEQDFPYELWSEAALLGLYYVKLAELQEIDEGEAVLDYALDHSKTLTTLRKIVTSYGPEDAGWVIQVGFSAKSLQWTTTRSNPLGILASPKMGPRIRREITRAKQQNPRNYDKQAIWEKFHKGRTKWERT